MDKYCSKIQGQNKQTVQEEVCVVFFFFFLVQELLGNALFMLLKVMEMACCYGRWYTYLNSECKKGSWTEEEDMILCEVNTLARLFLCLDFEANRMGKKEGLCMCFTICM